jgi:hypothetical protein
LKILAAALLCLCAIPAESHTATFDLTPDQFAGTFNLQAGPEAIDEIVSIKKISKDRMRAVFADQKFQKKAKALSELHLGREKVVPAFGIEFTLARGKISKIVMTGSRAEPFNLATFGGVVAAAIKTLNPSMDRTQLFTAFHAVRVLRRDFDPTIGQPTGISTGGGVFTCLSMPSDVTADVACIVEPP